MTRNVSIYLSVLYHRFRDTSDESFCIIPGYTILDLDFYHSAASLPIPGKKISHADYFRGKGIVLKYPRHGPMIVVEGRRKEKIYFPPELVTVST